MVNDIDSLVEQKIDEKLGKYNTERRRTDNMIRDRLQEELQLRPKTVHELKNAISAKKSTVENHLSHLQNLEIVEPVEFSNQKYWRLKK